ncbi:hypothetical protein ACJMK2_025398 [Sinanodonta woodiana]|uniref:Uncharacterized protein n=1 Tax=Sinanodonta woodiana TaxID=1069815 RepID=A0ABD3XJY4_SINWO
MERIRKIKKLVKNVGSNKIMGTFSKQSRALAGMSNVAEHYDHGAGVIAFEEEMMIIKDLRDVHPFKTEFFIDLKRICSYRGSLSQQDNKAWVQHHTFIFGYEKGK